MELYALIAFYLIILLYSIILHEVAHGVVALWLGDHTAKDAGRLTLQPLPHMDPIGSVLVPLTMVLMTGGRFAFGWAKPVPYNPLNLIWQKWGSVAVAFAGPATNFLLALIAAIIGSVLPVATDLKQEIVGAMTAFDAEALVILVAGDMSAIFFAICGMAIFWNVLLGVFNLIPIPPLDGSKLLYTLFPIKLEAQQFLEKYGFFILIFILFTPLAAPFHTALEALWTFFYSIAL